MTRSSDVTIRRTGQPALRLRHYGLAAQSSSRTTRGARQSRWHELELWSDDGSPPGPEQKHCVVVRYCSQWEGELGHDYAVVVPRRKIGEVLVNYDSMAHVLGYPPGTAYERKQERLEREVRAGYEHAVSDLLEEYNLYSRVPGSERPT